MKSWLKMLIILFSVPLIAILSFASYYLINNLQGIIEPYQIGNPGADQKILIASQGSDFKESLLYELTEEIQDKERFLSIVDCTQLDREDLSKWDACVIIHTTQIHGMPKAAESFLINSDTHSNVILVTTSGGGDEEIRNFDVDGISSVSRMSVIPDLVDSITFKLDCILNIPKAE